MLKDRKSIPTAMLVLRTGGRAVRREGGTRERRGSPNPGPPLSLGDLTMPDWANRAGLDGLSTSMIGMVTRLQALVGTIRQYSHESAAMAQQIAASTGQMTASTEEVAGGARGPP